MNVLLRSPVRVVVVVVVTVAVLAAAILWSVTRGAGSAAVGGLTRSAAVTVANGGVLDLGPSGLVRISPGGVNRDGVLRARVLEGSLPPADGVFSPLGPRLSIELDGARLTRAATVEFPVRAPTAMDPASPFAPTGMFLDEGVQRWVPAASEYDANKARLVVHASHFSSWGAFSWDWAGPRDFLKGLLDATFGIDVLAAASPPSCAREGEARAHVRSQVTGGSDLLWCLDLDADNQLLLRVVNNRRMAIQVQMFPGTELSKPPLQPLSIKYLGPITDQWLAARGNIRIVVLGPRESATFRVTDQRDQTGVGTAPSAVSYLTDVLDIGIEELSWTLGKFGAPAATDREQLYRTLFASGRLANCISGGLNDKSIVADPGSQAALGRSLGELVLGCVGDETAQRLPDLASDLVTAGGFLGSLVGTGLRMVQDLLAGGEYFVDLFTGRNNFFITLASIYPGGLWVSPDDRTQVTAPPVHLAARAYPTRPGDPAVQRVDFRASSPSVGSYETVCSLTAPTHDDVYECDWDLSDVPSGEIKVSFDVYDTAGGLNLAPNGVRTIVSESTPPPPIASAPSPVGPTWEVEFSSSCLPIWGLSAVEEGTGITRRTFTFQADGTLLGQDTLSPPDPDWSGTYTYTYELTGSSLSVRDDSQVFEYTVKDSTSDSLTITHLGEAAPGTDCHFRRVS